MVVFYAVCMGIGFLFALLGAVFGEIFGHGVIDGHGVEFEHGVEAGGHGIETETGHSEVLGQHDVMGQAPGAHDMPGASVFNTITLSTFIAFFGGGGLIGTLVFGLGPLGSLATALPTGLVLAGGQFLLFVKVFIGAQASSEPARAELVGCEATVIASISKGRIGQVSYAVSGSRFTAPALCGDEQEIPLGTKVKIYGVRGATVVVKPIR